MSPWLLAVVAGLLVASIQYGWRELRSGWATLPAALLRVGAVALVVALLLDAPASRAKPVTVWAALDASISMARGDSTIWRASRDSLRRLAAESVFVFGDSIRRMSATTTPADQSSSLRPAVERAIGSGHPLVVLTDGELDDPDAETHGLLRVIDESGEDYLYPDKFFMRLDLPQPVESALRRATG
jgi:hypothetical protein